MPNKEDRRIEKTIHTENPLKDFIMTYFAKKCRIRNNDWHGVIVKVNESIGGEYPGSSYPVVVEITHSTDGRRTSACKGLIYDYRLSDVLIRDKFNHEISMEELYAHHISSKINLNNTSFSIRNLTIKKYGKSRHCKIKEGRVNHFRIYGEIVPTGVHGKALKEALADPNTSPYFGLRGISRNRIDPKTKAEVRDMVSITTWDWLSDQ